MAGLNPMHATIDSKFDLNGLATAELSSTSKARTRSRTANSSIRSTGHRALFCSTSAAAGGTVEIEFTLPARSAGARRHIHARITETFRVVSGQLMVEVGERGHMVVLKADEAVTIAPGTPHGFRNASDAAVVFRCTVTPGAAFEDFIRSLYAPGPRDGRTDAAGMPVNFWQLVLILQRGDVLVPGVAVALQQWLIGGLAQVARRCGAERALAPYLTRTRVR